MRESGKREGGWEPVGGDYLSLLENPTKGNAIG